MGSKDGIMLESTKIEMVCNWVRPTSMIDIKSFIGLAGYYKQFISGFYFIAASLTKLSILYFPFEWSD